MKISKHPINLLGGGQSRVDYVNESINYELKEYFNDIIIAKKDYEVGNFVRISTVPVIALFTNKKYRDAYLEYTKDSTNKYELRLRAILNDEISRKNHYALMIERIGDTLVKHNVETFQTTTLEYTKETRITDGKRQKYYLNVKGIKSEDKDVKDLSELYLQIKELRNKNNSKQKTLSKNA